MRKESGGGGNSSGITVQSAKLKDDSILIFPSRSNIVNDTTDTNGVEYYSKSHSLHIIGSGSTLDFRGYISSIGGVLILTRQSNMTFTGNCNALLLCGSNNTLNFNNNVGTVISGSYTNFNDGNACNLILGGRAKLSNKSKGGNIIVGITATIDCTMSCNLMGGLNFILTENALSSQNGFWTILSLDNTSKQIEEIRNRIGIIFVAGKDTKNGGNLYYSNVTTAPIYVHGYQKYTENANIIDSDGNYLIQNGKSTLEKRIESLEQRIAELESKLSQSSID